VTTTETLMWPAGLPVGVTIFYRVRPEFATLGYSARDPYVERYWLPLLGPTATALLRRLALDALTSPGSEAAYDVGEMACCLGVAPMALRRVVRRLEMFGFLVWENEATWLIDVMLPAVNQKHWRRLPGRLRHELEGP
jgi:hypothetical protein